MKKTLYIIIGLGLMALLAGVALWRFDAAGRNDLEQAMRQYGETRSALARYESLKKQAGNKKQGNIDSLFAEVNQICVNLGLSRRVGAMRPAQGDRRESLDLQIRALYLDEFLQFLHDVESLVNVSVESLSLMRSPDRQLDVAMRLVRKPAGV